MEYEDSAPREYGGIETDMQQVLLEMQQQDEEAKKNSRWRQIANGKTATLRFTGRIFKRDAQYEGGTSAKLDFELEEKTGEGKNKLFSTGSKSRVARVIAQNIKTGNLTMLLSREGEGKNTTYKVSVPE